jgi:hypothetical protein
MTAIRIAAATALALAAVLAGSAQAQHHAPAAARHVLASGAVTTANSGPTLCCGDD